MLLAFLFVVALVVEGSIWIWLLRLADLDMPLGSLACAVAPPRLVIGIPIKFALR